MRHNKLELYVHLVWATWDRQPVISERMERDLYRELFNQAVRLNCENLAVGGVEDHVHILVKMPATLSVADLVKHLKGTTSHFVNQAPEATTHIKWQGSYCAFSISRWDVKKICRYIENQKEHHNSGSWKPALELSDGAALLDS